MMSLDLINLQSLAILCLDVSHVEETAFVHIDDTSAAKMVVMAGPLPDLYWAGTRLMKSTKFYLKPAGFYMQSAGFHMK